MANTMERRRFTGNASGHLLSPRHWQGEIERATALLNLWQGTPAVSAAKKLLVSWLHSCERTRDDLANNAGHVYLVPAWKAGLVFIERGFTVHDMLVNLLAAYLWLKETRVVITQPHELAYTLAYGFLRLAPCIDAGGVSRYWPANDSRRFGVQYIERRGLLGFLLNVKMSEGRLKENLELWRQQMREPLPTNLTELLKEKDANE